MTDDDLTTWRAAYEEPTTGWNFDSFVSRVTSEEPPWSYEAIVRDVLVGAGSVLDLGTGGGERLSAMQEALPADAWATEGWEPNVSVARAALEPRGITVVRHASPEPLPFSAERFDVVMSRHTAYDVTEVRRVLRSGGTFVTQQVDGRNLGDVAALFGTGPAFPDVTLASFTSQAETAGFTVVRAQEWSGAIRFRDVATFLSYLRMIPWHLPADFSVDRYRAELRSMTSLDFTERRFLLVGVSAGWLP